jgi:hypothetical protein
MYILAIKGKETEGAYAPSFGDVNVLYLFQEQDDAERHSDLLLADDYPEMAVIEIDDDVALFTCKEHGYSYCIVTPEDIIIPPKEDD